MIQINALGLTYPSFPEDVVGVGDGGDADEGGAAQPGDEFDPRRGPVRGVQRQEFGHLAEIGVVEEISGRTAVEDDDLDLLVSAQLIDDSDQLDDSVRADDVHGRIRESNAADLRRHGLDAEHAVLRHGVLRF
ncbi:hypothetical protein [Streptomyces sp900129855]|uniref:Uncharacterized protein n=1 Tax=Streptomyces sp. 900129855 TaxID=3155129 RepID=A0ABV2ZJ95_9ACTN